VATPATQAWTYADIPGHGSFGSHLSAALAAARAVVFVVDSSDQSMWPQVAARLYAILTNPAIAKPAVPVIVVCNKVRTYFSTR
jgi:signal recognition particle receptor subunit beta